MSTILTKDILVGRPAVPGDPGTPPVSPSPGYCLDVPKTRTVYQLIFIPIWNILTRTIDGYVQYAVSHVEDYIDTVCYPGTPGSPGTPPTAGIPATATSYQQGWNASATSIETIAANQDFAYQHSVPGGTIGIVVGLNSVNEGSGYVEIEHGWYCHSGQYQIMESGVARTAPANFVTTDVFTLVRLGGLVMYFLGSTLVYTSLTRSTASGFIDASLYFGGDQIL